MTEEGIETAGFTNTELGTKAITIRYGGNGLPIDNSSEVGDLFCKVHIVMPKSLTKAQLKSIGKIKKS